MSESTIQAVVLAAGKSTRFNTGNSKLLEKICGQELILYPLNLFSQLAIPTIVVVGHQADVVTDLIQKHHPSLSFVHQPIAKGTGDALCQTKNYWQADHILVINGDMPLVTEDIIKQLLQKHIHSNASVSFITAHATDQPIDGYGRIVQENRTLKIVEAKDLTDTDRESCCINAGIYLFKKDFLDTYINSLNPHNAAQEFYITDLIKIANDHNLIIETISAPFDRIRGINTLKELWIAEQIKRSELISYWMEKGVRFDVAQTTHLDIHVSLGAGTKISAGTHLRNNTKIGKNCIIEPFCIIDNTEIADGVTIYSHSVISNATIESNCKIGPFAHIHHQSILKEKAVVGNFVEVTRTTLGSQSKAKHLTYLGDTATGSHVNIGAGTITCNYDGKEKHKTVIEDNVFVGSNNTLIAPLVIHQKAYTAAGSTINTDVPAHALAIGRSRQINKENYVPLVQAKTENPRENSNNNEQISFIGTIKAHDLLSE
jgi:bifunctional UDP-N-acetylglucosamine pyrophosphorylase/glucosamine-1-phosphate N-acetyltransferase